MRPLLSIVVPTKNRYIYLKHLIQLVDSFKSDELELVIQDNSDNNADIVNFLNSLNSSIVKYFYSKEKLSMSANADLAILHSIGEYVCFIGDDDGVCRNIIDCVKWMKKNNIDALRSKRTGFIWGDSNNKNNSMHINNSSACVIYDKPELSYKFLNPINELNKILKKGFQTIDYIPVVYNGIVKRDVLDKVFEIGNTFFPGSSPDISNGVALAFFTKKLVYVDFPVIISGASKMTGGGIYRYNRNGIAVKLEEVGFISQSSIDNWEKDIPRLWANKLAWPESGIKALRYVNHTEFIEKLNRNYMYAAFAIYYIKYFKIAYMYTPNKIIFLWNILAILFSNGFRVIKNKIVSSIFPDHYVGRLIKRNISDIKEAEKFLYKINDSVIDKFFL